jgi:hypothetical protein
VSKEQVRSRRDLWKEALEKLSEDWRDVIEGLVIGSLGSPGSLEGYVKSVISTTRSEYKAYCMRGWHTKKGDQTAETNLRIQTKEVLCCALKFDKLIQDTATLDPTGICGAVWGVIAGGLQLLQNDQARVAAVFDSASVLARYLVKYELLETHYRDRHTDGKDHFEDCMIEAYVALLGYASAVIRDLDIPTGRKTSLNTSELRRAC